MAQQHPSTQPVQPTPQHADEDEVIHVPDKKHRARWIMLILLVVMILTTFTVGDEIVQLMTGRGRASTYASWNHPGEGRQSVSAEEWQTTARSLHKMYTLLGADLKDAQVKETVATTLILSALGERAGVSFTDKELGDFIKLRFGSATNYHLILPRYDTTAKEFEGTLRRYFVAQRYAALLAGAWNTPDVDTVVKNWKTQHQEYAFDYVELPVEGVLAEVKAVPLSDEELQKYFDGLPQPRKDSFKSKEKIAAEVAGIAYEGVSTDALFAKYPKPTDEAELEKQARAYYDGFAPRRFRNPTATSQADFLKPYTDVAGQARSEALIYGALGKWLEELRAREAKGESFDLAAEAASIGLAYHKLPDPTEQELWVTSKPASWMGIETPAMIFGNSTDAVPGKLYPAVIVDDTGFTLPRILARADPAMPPFSEIAEKLRDEIWNTKAKELAKKKLEDLRDQFGERPKAPEGQAAPSFLPQVEEAKFYEVARGAGLEAKLRDYKERMPAPGETPSAIDGYVRTQAGLFAEKVGTVLAAGTDFEGKHAYLVRVRGVRDPDPARMKPNEFAMVTMGARSAAQSEFNSRALSLTALESRYGLSFVEKGPDSGQ